jgi:hypothetical protein
MHLMPRPLEFAPSVGEFVSDYELPTNADGRDSVCKVISDYVIFTTLCKMSTDCNSFAKSSVMIVAFPKKLL